jgi:predicted deacylase
MDNAIFRAVIDPADVLIDLHGGDMVEALVPFSIYSVSGNEEVDTRSVALGKAFGLPYLVASRPQPGGIGGTTAHAAAAAGIPSIIAEAGSSGLLTEPETQMMVDGIGNALRSLGMLDGEVQPSQPVEIGEFTWLRSPVQGMWYPSVDVGARVLEGQKIGRIGNLYGDTLVEISAPHDGVILFITSAPAMPLDGLIIAVGGT